MYQSENCDSTHCIGTQAHVAYKYIDQYEYVWNDRGSGADRDVAIWTPSDFENGFYPLGDTAEASHQIPTSFSATVSALTPDALAPPMSYIEVWRDRGSGADQDVKIFRLIPKSSYTCLGYVAVNGYNTLPDLNRYRY